MKQFNTFIFESCDFHPADGRIELKYSLDDDIHFVETVLLPSSAPAGAMTPELNAALFGLHLIGGVSYYKTCIPKQIDIRSGSLAPEQAAFWNATYENGLGEFFFRNDIDFRGLVNFPSKENVPAAPVPAQPRTAKRVLVPIGGGKDSVVTAELLRKAGFDVTLFRMGHHPLIEQLAATMGLPLLSVDRKLSPALFKLNEAGALNGHVPITAYLSFLTIVVALLEGFDAVAMSCERSASEGNLEFHGKRINHQWSKSLEFERSFQNYVRRFITPEVNCFSALRPLSELAIAKLFSTMPQYFRVTTSCNNNWKILSDPGHMKGKLWCGSCPKCAFVFLLYSAFLPKKTLTEIFGKNLFEDAALLPLYRELLGLEGQKPFECVGTPEESKAAFALAHERGDLEGTAVMKMFVEEVLPTIKNPKKLIDGVMAPSTEHAIPSFFKFLP